ncbi:hypothetical protein TR51_15860 [Kitasatospora griseola]|uniref:Uncharacterized protein n=1 Tax=Kitasatospora griseola TaxID=2064 RepID=A0A0D0PS34_KITGR|nr:hypothetical protein [Kitasatospora griseola]KIQ65384.1 hypothetical protein TR51_15860 [Kitasatospora griseola]
MSLPTVPPEPAAPWTPPAPHSDPLPAADRLPAAVALSSRLHGRIGTLCELDLTGVAPAPVFHAVDDPAAAPGGPDDAAL